VGNKFGETLEKYRSRQGIAQSRLAGMVDVDHSYISRLESGMREPSRSVVEKMCDVLLLEPKQRNEMFAAAGFLQDSEYVVTRLVLKDIDTLLNDQNMSPVIASVILGQLQALALGLETSLGRFRLGTTPETVQSVIDTASEMGLVE
jgi:predicted transcriptional regulator